MKKLNLTLLICLITTFFASGQDTRLARIIAMKGDVSVDAVPAENGQEIFERNTEVNIVGDSSYVTILSSEGDLKTFKKGRLKVRYLVSSMRTRAEFRSNIGCPNPMAWITKGRGFKQFVLGDSIFLRWKTPKKVPFEIKMTSIFEDSLFTALTEIDSVYLNVGTFFEKEKYLIITVCAGRDYHADQLALQRLDPEKLALAKRELAEVTGTPADRKAIRLALLIKHELYLDYFYEKSLMKPEEFATLSSDTKRFILNNDVEKFQ